MNIIDTNSPIFTLSSLSHYESESGRRLIVLVPESEIDTSSAARKIWELANALGSRVQFLGLCKDVTREPSLRRQIISMASIVGDDRVFVESKIEFGNNWLKFVKPNLNKGDVIACFAEHNTGLANRSLSQILAPRLNTTIYILSGLYSKPARSNWPSSAMVWAGSIAIISAFSLIQVSLAQLSQDWAHTSLFFISLLFEFGVVSLWNSLI